MKPLTLFLFLLVVLLLTMSLEALVPSLAFLGQVHLVFFTIIFCFAALALPFFGSLFFGFITGLIEGLLVLEIHGQHVEIRLGWFIIFFMLWAFMLQLVSDITDGVRWELHSLGAGLCTATFLLGEFFLLSFSRGNFFITGEVFLLSFLSAGISLILAPLFYGCVQFWLSPPKQNSTTYLTPL
ncbi:MAG: hypothetical protein DVB29_02225 [Verrucomicrobia bacterium]|nr:MAG: hypothetical protein DVB29_02225 [Verrucomicrobiota bacterium]